MAPKTDQELVVKGVSRTFPGVHGGKPTLALQATDLIIPKNDFVTILGPSGCGKSTLLRIIAGLDKPTTGTVTLEGKPVAGPGADRGMVFQSYTLFPWLTIRQNVGFGLREKGLPEKRPAKSSIAISTRWGCAALKITGRNSFRAACSSAPPLPAHWPMIQKSCCSTSPSAHSTTRHAA